MLEYLHIADLALIEDVRMDFAPGMNVLTGETGAGKSFILKALDFVLGGKLDADMVRPGAEKATVEALFRREGERFLIKRTLFCGGKSHVSVNGKTNTRQFLRDVKETLVTSSGQHGQQKLLQPAFFDKLIERQIVSRALLEKRSDILQKLEEMMLQKRQILERKKTLSGMRDLLELQLQDIKRVQPTENEDANLEEARQKIRRREKDEEIYAEMQGYLHGGDDSPGLLSLMPNFVRLLRHMAASDERFQAFAESSASFESELCAMSSALQRPPASLSDDLPMSLDEIETRLFELSQLKRKLKKPLSQILELGKELAEQLSFLDQCELAIKSLKKKEESLKEELAACLSQILPMRREGCRECCSKLEAQLQGLGFSDGVRVFPEFDKVEIWEGVFDEKVRLLWAPNPGQSPQPLDKIASGGELSRFLLALTGVMPLADSATILFDEIDAGVGGLTLNSLAKRLQEISAKRQTILVTHWPQIAVQAQRHFRVEKSVDQGMTSTRCVPLNDKERGAELSRMAGGGTQGEAMAKALEESFRAPSKGAGSIPEAKAQGARPKKS